MKWHLTESRTETDNTDELPVLSEEAVLEFRLRESAQATAESDPLEASVDALREALDVAEQRWATLESRLATQDRAIAELKDSFGEQLLASRAAESEPETKPEPEPEPEPEAETRAALLPDPEPFELTPPSADRAAIADSDDQDADQNLLEKIAALETYIAGRADRWREMERELKSKSRRIAELETELEQRIAREEQLQERLHDEGDRSDELRNKLRRLYRQIEVAEPVATDQDLDTTREMLGRAIVGSRVRFHHDSEIAVIDNERAPRILCLSSELPEAFVMSKDAITIGRAPDCDIEIATDFVSRKHATIRRQDSDTIIEDRSSTNGVYVNAVRVDRKALTDGDEITIGESRFRFVAGEPLN